MTKLANHIISKTHRIVNEQEEALFNASQFNRLTKVRARKAIANTMSSPEGIALLFLSVHSVLNMASMVRSEKLCLCAESCKDLFEKALTRSG